MYSERKPCHAQSRMNDEFLRRMLGGEMMGKCPAPSPCTSPTPSPVPKNGVDCRGNRRRSDEGTVGGCGYGCPTEIPAPALAMVYSPRQCWQNAYSPEVALAKGTLFADLWKPWEAGCRSCELEVRPRK